MNELSDLSPEATKRLYLTLLESLEEGEQLPAETLRSYLGHPDPDIRTLALALMETPKLRGNRIGPVV